MFVKKIRILFLSFSLKRNCSSLSRVELSRKKLIDKISKKSDKLRYIISSIST